MTLSDQNYSVVVSYLFVVLHYMCFPMNNYCIYSFPDKPWKKSGNESLTYYVCSVMLNIFLNIKYIIITICFNNYQL